MRFKNAGQNWTCKVSLRDRFNKHFAIVSKVCGQIRCGSNCDSWAAQTIRADIRGVAVLTVVAGLAALAALAAVVIAFNAAEA